MSHASNKTERLLQIEALLLARESGYTRAELARKIGVNRSTITRYLPDLTTQFAVYETDDDYLRIDQEAYRVHVHLLLHEAMAVHLSTRLLANHMDKQNPHAAAALRKLGVSLERLAPQVSHHLLLSAEVMDNANLRHDPRFLRVVEALTLAWAEQKRVKIWHRGKDNRIYDYDFAPYFIEPYAAGKTTHVLGVHGPREKRITLKIERIERVEALREKYEIPSDFDPTEYLQDSWGIWYADGAPQEVVLKFHPRVVRRVKETTWHRNEEKVEQSDGYLIWQAKIAEPQEMMPWIRGWGADVEVLEPEELRVEMLREVKRLMQNYQLASNPSLDINDTDYDEKRAESLFRG